MKRSPKRKHALLLPDLDCRKFAQHIIDNVEDVIVNMPKKGLNALVAKRRHFKYCLHIL